MPFPPADNGAVTTLTLPNVLPAKTQARGRTGDRALAFLIALLVTSALVGRLSYLAKPWDHDARMFVYLGKLVCDGGWYCHDVIDNKFPTVGMMTSVCWRAFGTFWPAYVLVQLAMAVGGALLLARSAARHFGEHARLPVALFAIVYLNLNVAVFGGFQLETLQTFFAILAAGAAMEALCGRRAIDAFVVGLAAGCAMMLKPTGGAVMGAFALAAMVQFAGQPRKLLAHGLSAACGVAVPGAVVLAYLFHTNILKDMPDLYRQIARYAAETPIAGADYLKPIIVCVIVGLPIVVRGWVCRRDCIRGAPSGGRSLLIFSIAWFALELIGAVMQRRMYSYHFLPVAAPAALLYGVFPRRNRIAALTAALAPAALLSILGARETIAACWGQPYRLAVSDYIVAHTNESDRVWQDSMPRLLLETNRKPGARVPLTFLFFNHDAAPLEFSAIMLRDFELRRPKYIIMPADLERKLKYESDRAPEMQRRPTRAENYRIAWRRIDDYVRRNYLPEKSMDQEMIWRRSD
jgi:hypothetical protein